MAAGKTLSLAMAGSKPVLLPLPLLLRLLVTFLFWFSPPLADAQLTDPKEVAALRAVKKKLQDPNNILNWTKKLDPCSSYWAGVRCTWDITDGYNHVLELRLLNMNLTGTMAPELGQLTYVTTLDFLWNHLSGSIPKEIGYMTALQFLLLSGNQLTGSLPDELGDLQNLNKFQLDLNMLSGPIPKSFVNLSQVQHFHMNNNNFSGQLPPELASLPKLKHILLDNNNLNGYLPPEFYNMSSLRILQLDNNNFAGTGIPENYSQMTKLVKLSLRNCGLQGTIPDLSKIPNLTYLDLSLNQLTGEIPSNRFSDNITTIILSNNSLNGSIPSSFSGFPRLQKLYLDNNTISGFVPSTIWENITFTTYAKLDINFGGNLLSDISGTLDIPTNVTLKLSGNPVCSNAIQRNISQLCGFDNANEGAPTPPPDNGNQPSSTCPVQCPTDAGFQYAPNLPPGACFCAAPFGVGIRLRSPSIAYFPPYRDKFDKFIAGGVTYPQSNQPILNTNQIYVNSVQWEPDGPRLRMFLLIFPEYSNITDKFDGNELKAIMSAFANFTINGSDLFGPYDLLNFTAGFYSNEVPTAIFGSREAGLTKGALAGIILGSVSGASVILGFALLLTRKLQSRSQAQVAKNKSFPKGSMKMDGVKAFSFEDLQAATDNFTNAAQIGEGGYGKVYKGTVGEGVIVAIKRAQQSSLQGDKEFYTEIEMLSRLHHRNLVSLVGFCDEEDEQMLVYEFMPNGSLHDLLSAKYRFPVNIGTRLHIALGAARGILYLHTEADPPIIHRDIKANNILLDSKWTAKVSDFGISRLAPISDAKGLSSPHISTNVKGTPGYVDPEYFLTHKLTEKSDVYSLGVVFLELLTGMQPISHGRNIVREVNSACQSGMMFSIIDRSMGDYPSECIKKFMGLALRCSMDDTKNRPSMLEVVRELENISSMLPESDNQASVATSLPPTSPGTSTGSAPSSSLYQGERNTYATMELYGSNLVSGVINTINPR